MTSPRLVDELRAVVGDRHVADDPDVIGRHVVDWTGAVGAHRAIVVRPGTTDEVVEVLRACSRAGVAVVPQGGNTGLVAGSVPPVDGWVVLSSERMDTIDAPDLTSGQITVGAGVTLSALAAALEGTGWRYGVDFGARDRATIGGTIATNAGGVGVFRHGDTRRQVLGVRAVLADGRVIGDLRAIEKDNTGYALASLIAGSEGTLAVVTAARLRLVVDPPARCTALVGVASTSAAVELAWSLRRRLAELEVCELLGPGCAALVAAHRQVSIPGAAEPAALLVESSGDDADLLATRLSAALDATPAVRSTAVALDAGRRHELWAARDGITEAVAASGRPLKLDVSLPADRLVDVWDAIAAHVAAEAPTARLVAFGHVCDHNLHLNVTGLEAAAATRVEHWALQAVAAAGGSISAEHGIGRRRMAQLGLVRTDAERSAMAAVKAAWDPAGILNPGVVVAAR